MLSEYLTGLGYPTTFAESYRDFLPERCLVSEGSPNGVLAARAAGTDVYDYTALTDPAKLAAVGATGLITRLSEVPVLLAPPARGLRTAGQRR